LDAQERAAYIAADARRDEAVEVAAKKKSAVYVEAHVLMKAADDAYEQACLAAGDAHTREKTKSKDVFTPEES
jgi:hypothetical protein